MSDRPRPDLYISADVETDGPIPGPYSMLSFALCAASRYDGTTFQRCHEDVFYRELAPISDEFDPEALAVNGLDREQLMRKGTRPDEAMREAAQWVAELADGHRPVLVAYPVAFDWSFLYWYFIRFNGESPFGFSSCLDIRTLYQARALTVHDESGKDSMPTHLLAHLAHTHHATDDALEQAELFNNLFEWALSSARNAQRAGGQQPPIPEWLEPLGAGS